MIEVVSCRSLVGGLLVLSAVTGCVEAPPESLPALEVAGEFLLGEDPGLRARGLTPGETYTIEAERSDPFRRRWTSLASFVADASGRIDVARDAPTSGSYAAIDRWGLLWSMRMPRPPGEDWVAPEPLDYHDLVFRLTGDGTPLAETDARQWVLPPTVQRRAVEGGAVADLFLPRDDGAARPGLLVLGGSGGGKRWAAQWAGLLAEQGYAAMALAYFNAEGLPEHLAEIPLDYVEAALDRLADSPGVDRRRLGIVGYSKGAELALLIASRREDVRAVVAIAPGSAAFQGFKPPRHPTISSWTAGGEEIPFVPNAYDKKFFDTFDGMYLWYRTLDQHREFDAAAIAVENVAGDILLLSGAQDRIWPATLMAEQLVARLYVAEFPHTVRHLPFADAGHGIAVPPGDVTTSVAERLGGTPQGNALARERGWQEIETFLAGSLRER